MAEVLPKVDPEVAIAAIRDARPPATDRFTYLTILEANLSAEVLPALNEILQDAELTQEIGWDLVFNLVNLPGSETCLETIARLGNPREVILKVLETLELLHIGDSDTSQRGEQGGETEPAPTLHPQAVSVDTKFITLLGLLAILHRRIKTKYPSRFLAQTLQTVYNTYRPSQEVTAAIINLVHSLSGRRRPALPSRKSSINVANPDQDGDASKNAPDPEAEESKDDKEDPAEAAMQQKMLLSFATSVLELYTSVHHMAWAARLLEFYQPEKLVPGRKTLMAAFREDQELLERDAIVGQLVALIKDLGLNSCSEDFLKGIWEGPIITNPLATIDSATSPDEVPLSTGASVSLIAYWVFSSTIFDADQPTPRMNIFPEHFSLLEKFLQDDAEGQIRNSMGTIEALVAIGLWLHANNLISVTLTGPLSDTTTSPDDTTSDFMKYLHLITLIALYHQRLHVRNAASTLAGLVLHADPSDEDRLRILYDLLENCTFASLKACAITWLREEILAASAAPPTAVADAANPSAFATPHALDTLQYVVFPSLGFLNELDAPGVVDYLAQNSRFLLQAVNFGLFVWSSRRWAHVLPANTDATVKERWFQPLAEAVERVGKSMKDGGELEGEDLGSVLADLDVLRERMPTLAAAEGFRVAEEAEADRA